MRDDSTKWHPALGMDRHDIDTGGVRISLIHPDRMTLISGPCNAALEWSGIGTAIGWPEVASGHSYALRCRRDQILVVNGPDLTDGWHADRGLAVSDMTDGFGVVDICGGDALAILCRRTEISHEEPSRSANRAFFGYAVMIYAYDAQNHFRMHVPRQLLDGLWSLLQSFAQQASVVAEMDK